MSYLLTINLLRDSAVVNDQHQLRNQIISTRLSILFFIVILLSFLFYFILAQTTISIVVQSPTKDHFSQLDNNYKDTLQCSCTNLFIIYGTFVSLEVTFHQVCFMNLDRGIDVLF